MTDIQQPGRVWSEVRPDSADDARTLAKRLAAARPPLLRALARDAAVFAYHRGDVEPFRTRLGRIRYALLLPFHASEYLGLALYRLRMRLHDLHVPIIPALLNYTCSIVWGMRIGNPVVIKEGVYIPHGQIVVDGLTYISTGCVLCPWITIGLVQGDFQSPYLEEGVFVGTGARVLGPIRIGYGARIGANAVVLADVPAWSTAVGVPARNIPIPDLNTSEPPDGTGEEAS